MCATWSLALTPKIIKSGITPFNPDIFTVADIDQAVKHNTEAIAIDAVVNQDEQRCIIFNPINIG